jgi:hypothetical protein
MAESQGAGAIKGLAMPAEQPRGFIGSDEFRRRWH